LGVERLLPVAILLVLSGVLGATPLLAGSTPSFSAPKNYGTGQVSSSVAIGDLNGDGKQDLATANLEGNTLSVLLNKGLGFGAKADYGTGREPHSVAIGDLNGDGRLDLASANAGEDPSTVSVILNRGGGTFQAKVDYESGYAPYSVATGDLNGDGKPDIATADYGSSTVSVLLNRGDGTFHPGVQYLAGRGPHHVAIGDLNGDGKADLASANQGLFVSTVSVLLNNGNGSFQAKRDFESGGNPGSVAIGDLNGDAKPDLVTANSGSDTLSVLVNNGDGSFQPKRDYSTGHGPVSVAIGDVNADGKPDMAAGNFDAGTVSVFVNAGNGTFRPKVDQVKPGVEIRAVAIGNLTSDRRPDLATANGSTDDLSVFVNTTGVCRVPNVRGKTLPAARRAITRVHCRVGKIRRAYSKGIKKGHVISGKPKVGTVLFSGRVHLVVSRGRRAKA
jgi:hypothetical protein